MPEVPSMARHLAPSAPPSWLVELLDILDERRVMVMRTALAILVGGLVLAAVLPNVLRPSVPVGILVALAAVAISAGAAFALDSADPIVKGPRHVRSSGADLLVQGRSTAETMAAVAERLSLEVATSETGTYGFIELGKGFGLTHAAVQAVGEALAAEGHRVIQADITQASEGDGVAEVEAGTTPLSRAVQFSETGLTLARIDAGRDLGSAQRKHPEFLSGLPGDIDAVLTSLPPVAVGADVDPVGLQRVFIVVVEGVSRRLDLLSTMEKYDTDGRAVHVLLIDAHAPTSGPAAAVPPLATEPTLDPLLGDRDAAAEAPPAPPQGLDLGEPHPADVTAPLPRIEPATTAADDADADMADADADADALDADALADDGPSFDGDGPKPAPLSPALAARLQRQQQKSEHGVEPPAPAVGGWQVKPADEVQEPAPGPPPAAPPASAPEARAPLASRPAAPAAPEAPHAPLTHGEPTTDELDPELLAAAFAMGELDELEMSPGEAAAPPARSPAAPPATPPTPGTPAAPSAAPPSAPAAPASITGGLSSTFQQRLPGEDSASSPDAPSPRNATNGANGANGAHAPASAAAPTQDLADVEAARPDESTTAGQVLLAEAPVIELPDVQDLDAFSAPLHTSHEEALGAADDGDDDPLGMTAALHQFTLERMDGDHETSEGSRDDRQA